MEPKEHLRAHRIRAKRKAGKPLTPEQETWIAGYEMRVRSDGDAKLLEAPKAEEPKGANGAGNGAPPPIAFTVGAGKQEAPKEETPKVEPTPEPPKAETPQDKTFDWKKLVEGGIDAYCAFVKKSQEEIALEWGFGFSDEMVDAFLRPACWIVANDFVEEMIAKKANPKDTAMVIVAAPLVEHAAFRYLQRSKKRREEKETKETKNENPPVQQENPPPPKETKPEEKPIPKNNGKQKQTGLFRIAGKG